MPKLTDHELEAILRKLPPRSLNSVLFNMANAYAQTGDLAMAAIGTSGNADFAAPGIMCKSFCVELLLKFFIAVAHPEADAQELKTRGVDLYGHIYSDLFDRIHEAPRRSIAASFSTVSGRQVDDGDFRRILKEDLGDDPFVSWRYVYETKTTRHLDPVLWDQVVLALGKAAERERRRIAGTDLARPAPAGRNRLSAYADAIPSLPAAPLGVATHIRPFKISGRPSLRARHRAVHLGTAPRSRFPRPPS